jgi:hypothetical protein
MIEDARSVIKMVNTYRYSPLYQILYRNRVVECSSSDKGGPCIRTMDIPFINAASDGRYYGCTYKGDNIGHYFILERYRSKWYISSSYGSEWVSVPVYIKEVSENDLREFLEAMSEVGNTVENAVEDVKTVIREFFTKYFLEGGLPKRYSNNESRKLRGRYIKTNNGISKELEIVLRGPLRIGYIESMEEYIQSLVTNSSTHHNGGYSSSRSHIKRVKQYKKYKSRGGNKTIKRKRNLDK